MSRSLHRPFVFRTATPRRRVDGAGFTLIELLLATAIGAIVLLVINATFFAALRLHNTTHEKIDDDLVVQRTLGILRKDLAGIMVPANPQATTAKFAGQLTSDITTTNDLDGTSERVTPDLYTNSGKIDGWSSFADVQRVAYYLSPASDGGSSKNLVRVLTRNLLPVVEGETENQTLLSGVRSAAISFFDGENWLDTWDSVTSTSLPSALKFSIVIEPRDRTSSPADPAPIELIVPVVVKTTATVQLEATVTAALP
jgi:type II secretion system protein J